MTEKSVTIQRVIFWALPRKKAGSGFPLYLFCEKAKKDAVPIPNAARPNFTRYANIKLA